MNNAINYLIEPFLTQFFLIDAICKGFVDENERREIFNDLANVFCVPINEETNQYYKVLNSDQYKRINDYSSYERLCRTIEFAEACGQDVGLTVADRVILAQKRESMLIKSDIFKQGKNLTRDIIADTLLNTAMNGNVDAMITLAYMEYHGICVCKDQKRAIKRMALCAKWNDLFGNLMGIAYDKKNRDAYYDTLFTVLKSANQKEVFEYLCEYNSYARTCKKNPVARIIEKAFGLNIVKRNVYDQIFAKVAFSELISVEDKEKLLLNKKKDAIVSLSEIPFDVNRDGVLHFDEKKASDIVLDRQEELHDILCGLSPAFSNMPALYRTVLIVGDDDYISEMYIESLRKGFGKEGNIIDTDAGMLSMQDFASAKENFILRGLSETKQSHTVFLIKNCHEIGEKELDELIKLLDYEYRRKFKLLDPTVSLDLSDAIIVLFASENNEPVKRLAEECDVIRTMRISEREKLAVIESTFKTRSKSYGCSKVKICDDCKKYLAPFKTGQIVRLIDGALKKAAYENGKIITAEALQTISAQQNIQCNRREFGYLGGCNNEEY